MKIKILTLLALSFLTLISCSKPKEISFKFAAFSDSRGSYNGVNEPVLSAIVKHITENNNDIKFVIFAGDMVNGSYKNPNETVEQLKHWKKIMAPLYNSDKLEGLKVYPVVGNHEIQHREDEENFRNAFPEIMQNAPDDDKGLSYSFDFGNTHFAAINTDRWYYGDPLDSTDDKSDWHYIKHIDWLEKDLKDAKANGAKHIFTFSHEMVFPVGGHLRDGLPNLGRKIVLPLDSTRQFYMDRRDRFWSLLQEVGADAHICGHEHTYGRQEVDGVYQILAGSAGAPLYAQNPKYGENEPDSVFHREFLYNDAIEHYKILNYSYGPGKKSQRSENYVGAKEFNYSIFEVFDDSVEVTTYGIAPKKGTNNEIDENYKVRVIDKFTIK